MTRAAEESPRRGEAEHARRRKGCPEAGASTVSDCASSNAVDDVAKECMVSRKPLDTGVIVLNLPQFGPLARRASPLQLPPVDPHDTIPARARP